jgi:opacity protein-like surface antigen
MKKILISLLTLAFSSQTALAAETGSLLLKFEGDFITGDGTFKATKSTDSLKTKNKKFNGMKGTVSFGYLAADDLWSDIALSYSAKKTKEDTSVTTTDPATNAFQKIDDKTFGLMINAYYGFNTSGSLTPYLTVGLGGKMNKSKILVPTNGIKVTSGGTALNNNAGTPAVFAGSQTSKNTTYFAYQAGFGTKVNFSPMMAVNFGYRAANHQGGTFQNLETGAGLKGFNQLEHNIFLGLEMAL